MTPEQRGAFVYGFVWGVAATLIVVVAGLLA